MILNIIDDFGKLPLCNKNPDRALHINDFVFPLCYRCMMLAVGIFLGTVIFYLLTERKHIKYNIKHFVIGILMIFPTFIDGLVQTLTIYESKNIIRVTTGLIAGIGFGLLIVIFLQYFEYLYFKFTKQKNL